MQRDGQNDTVHGSGDNHKKNDDLKLCTPRVKKVWQKTNNGNDIINTSRKISVQNSLLDSSDGTLVPDKTQTNNDNGIINTSREISVQNSLLDSSDDTLVPDKTQTNNDNDIIKNMRRPGTSSGDMHKNNDDRVFLPHGRTGVSSVVKLIKSAPEKKSVPKKNFLKIL